MDKHKTMAKVIITQVRSAIDRPKRQKLTIEALGIKKLNNPVEKELTPNIKGMIRAVNHLLKVEYK
jgi:large subunit ribosomal protein L30